MDPQFFAEPDKPKKIKPCVHESTRADGALDGMCLKCGARGFWHKGHRHDVEYHNGKLTFKLACPEPEALPPEAAYLQNKITDTMTKGEGK